MTRIKKCFCVVCGMHRREGERLLAQTGLYDTGPVCAVCADVIAGRREPEKW